MNLEQVATIRLTVAMKMELRTERGKKSLIHSLMLAKKISAKQFLHVLRITKNKTDDLLQLPRQCTCTKYGCIGFF